MGYRNDQYFGLVKAGEKGTVMYGSDALTPANNRPFVYPDRTVRVNSVLDAGNLAVEPKLKRGFIRSIADTLGGVSLSQSKCNFQFNPRVLNQSVNQNTKILDFLHQDPSQYAQPIPGNVSFNFTLFFDRSMELNKGGVDAGSDIGSDNPWEKYGPETVGVLHDLSALYSTIGMGIGSQQQDYILSVLENQIKGEINAANENSTVEVDEDGNVTTTGSAISDAASTQADYGQAASDFVTRSGNFGNTAFLLPLPVRVVFSSLYIVEGLVQNASVKFTKFNASMVPMQASVDLTMEAKYIGFAKKNTFFTEALKAREEAALLEAQRVEQEAEEQALFAAQAKAAIGTVRVGMYKSNGSSAQPFELVSDEIPLFAQDREAINTDSKTMTSFPLENNNRGIRSLFNSGSSVSVNFTSRIQLWRFTDDFKEEYQDLFSGSVLPDNLSNSKKLQIMEELENVSGLSPLNSLYTSQVQSTAGHGVNAYATALKVRENWIPESKQSATTLDAFVDMAEGLESGTNKAINDDRSTDTDPRYIADHSEFWWALYYQVMVTVSVDGVSVTGEGTHVKFSPGKTAQFSSVHDVVLDWPSTGDYDIDGLAAPV